MSRVKRLGDYLPADTYTMVREADWKGGYECRLYRGEIDWEELDDFDYIEAYLDASTPLSKKFTNAYDTEDGLIFETVSLRDYVVGDTSWAMLPQ